MSTRIHRHEGAPSFSNRLLRRIIRPMKRSAVIALLCVYLAFAASAVVSRAVFERLPHLEDEFAVTCRDVVGGATLDHADVDAGVRELEAVVPGRIAQLWF